MRTGFLFICTFHLKQLFDSFVKKEADSVPFVTTTTLSTSPHIAIKIIFKIIVTF